MGLFSWNCQHCGKSIRSKWVEVRHDFNRKTNPAWMRRAVVLTPNGTFKGHYDGYGVVRKTADQESAALVALWDMPDVKPPWIHDLFSYLIEDFPEVAWAEFNIYHERCWKEAGKPDYNPEVNPMPAVDQGFFSEKEMLPPRQFQVIERGKD